MVATQTAIAPVQSQQLADFAPPQSSIDNLIARFRAGLKDNTKLKNDELHALASMALAHNLDPFNGECWAIPSKGVMAGIKGLRKAADAQLPSRAFKNLSPRLLQHSEYDKYAIPQDAELASICEGTRSDATEMWIHQLKELVELLNGDYNTAVTLLPRPVWIGIGIIKKGDQSVMPRVQLVFKRAEADCLKRMFNLPFNIDFSRENGNNHNEVEGEWQEYPEGPPAPADEPERAEATPEDAPRPYTAEQVRAFVAEAVQRNPVAHERLASDKQQNYAASLINACFEGAAKLKDKARRAVQTYITGKASIKEWSAAEVHGLLKLLADESGDLSQDGYKEIQACLRAALVEEGQTDMFDQKQAEDGGTPEAA